MTSSLIPHCTQRAENAGTNPPPTLPLTRNLKMGGEEKRPLEWKDPFEKEFQNSRAFQKGCQEKLESICMSKFGYLGHLGT